MTIDPGTAAIVASSLLLAKEPLNKLLGPTLEYYGKEIESFSKKRSENLGRIFRKAISKAGSKLDEPGQAHPKILKGLLLDGSFCDDELTAEYYGGVLASSRTGVSRDDRGSTYINLVSRLSTYQIRTHFIIYTLMRRFFVGKELNPGMNEDRKKMRIYIPYTVYNQAMAFNENEDRNSCFLHSILGLNREDLVDCGAYGSQENLHKFYPQVTYPSSGFLVAPNQAGFELYIFGHGLGNEYTLHDFLNPDITLPIIQGIEIPNGAFSILEKQQAQKTQNHKKD